MSSAAPILVVDDSDIDRKLILAALRPQERSTPVIALRDGIEALDYLFCHGEFQHRTPGQPRVIMLDIHMPGADGHEVLRRIRGEPSLSEVPVVMFTSSQLPSDVARSYQLGANAYVVKPMGFDLFAGAVRGIVDFWGVLNEPPPQPAPAATVAV